MKTVWCCDIEVCIQQQRSVIQIIIGSPCVAALSSIRSNNNMQNDDICIIGGYLRQWSLFLKRMPFPI